MILAVDIGNTTIAVGGFEDGGQMFVGRLSSDCSMKLKTFADSLTELLKSYNANTKIRGAVLSSVVPQITATVCDAIKMVCGVEAIVVGPELETGLKIRGYDVSKLGNDRIVDAVAALNQFAPPIVIFDLGTATTMSVLDADGYFLGGTILPGIRLCADVLFSQTAQLPHVEFEGEIPQKLIGTDTVSCIRNGAVIGAAAIIDRFSDQVERELGQPVTVVVTGGQAKYVLPWCRKPVQFDEYLLIKGLYQIYVKAHK